MVEGSWSDKLVSAHHDHLYSHPKIPAKFWTYSFVADKLHPHHHMNLHDLMKKLLSAVKTVETEYFRNHKGSYYDAMPSVWKIYM